MTKWQRRLRLGLGLFVLLVAAAVVFSLRRPPPPPQPPPVAKTQDPNAVAEFARGTVTQAKGTSQEFGLRYERLITYKDGRSKLYGVTAEVPNRGGRSFTISGREATVAGNDGDVTLRGKVELRSSDGLQLQAEQARYRSADGSVRVPGRARFSRGRLAGEAVGLIYDQQQNVLSLLKAVRLKAAPDEQGRDSGTIESGSATLDRREKTIHFDRGTRIVREGQVITSDKAVATLTDDEERVRQLDLRGNSKVEGGGSASGLQAMSARDIDLVYGEDGQVLQQALLQAKASVVLRGAEKGTNRRLAAERIDIALAPDGATVTGLDARDRVRLDLPAEAKTPARVITAGTLAAAGTPESGLTQAVFRPRVVFVETAAKDAPPRRATSDRLDLALEGGFDTIRTADFSGGTRFEEGTLAATAAKARYDVQQGILHLQPGGEKRAVRPQVVDDQATIEADAIEVGLDGRKVDAKGGVKSDLKPRRAGDTRQGGADEPPRETHLPSMMKQDEPVFGTSDALAYDGGASRAVYTGRAQLWQGDTSIKGERVTLDDRTGDLAASGKVVSTMLLEQEDEQTKKKEKVRSVATSDTLVYEEALRRAKYTGTARLNGPEGDLSAPVIDLYLVEGGGEVERLEAYPEKAAAPPAAAAPPVSLKTPDGRRATGARLKYVSDGERYDMVGTPVRIIEECRETTGKTLTFFRSADRIIVDGNEQTRTEVKGSGGCSAPRLD